MAHATASDLVAAIRSRDHAEAKNLLASGVNGAEMVDLGEQVFARPLDVAVGNDDAAAVKLLLDFGVDPDALVFGGRPPIARAIERGHCDALRALVAGGADVERPDPSHVEQPTPLQLAIGDMAAMRILLAAGADIDRPDSRGATPLVHAARWGDEKAARLLLDRGADPDRVDAKGRSAAEVAEAMGNAECAALIRAAQLARAEQAALAQATERSSAPIRAGRPRSL